METLFIGCAVLGGTIMLALLVLSAAGLGHHGGFDHGGDFGGDVGHDFGGHAGGGDAHHGPDHTEHDGNWFLKAISLRSIVAALTFFGLAGMAALSAEMQPPQPLAIATAAGLAAMYSVYYLMKSLSRLTADGTERIGRAIGTEGTVYLTISAHNQAAGKIHFTLQNRLVEYEAMTSGEALPTGTRVVIVDVLGPDLVQVEGVNEAKDETANKTPVENKVA